MAGPPGLLTWCCSSIEARGREDPRQLEGIYRLSGQASHVKALRLGFEAGSPPARPDQHNVHSVGSLLKVGPTATGLLTDWISLRQRARLHSDLLYSYSLYCALFPALLP